MSVGTLRMGHVTGVLIAVVIVVVAVVAALVVGLRRRARSAAVAPTIAITTTDEPLLVPVEPIESGLVEHGGALLFRDPLDPTLAMVFGSPDVDERVGQQVAEVPGQLVRQLMGGTSAAARAGISAGEQSGRLVRLTEESVRAMKELQTIDAGGGAVYGVLRDGAGQFKHVVKFRPASAVSLAGGASNVLGAVAMQAQLAAIEKAIAEVAASVRQVQQTLNVAITAKRTAIASVLAQDYRVARETGQLTQAVWDQIANMELAVEEGVVVARGNLDRLLDGLSKGGTSERRKHLDEIQAELLDAIEGVLLAEQSQMQFYALRLWWLSSSVDKSLPAYERVFREAVAQQQEAERLRGVKLRVELERFARRRAFDYAKSPWDTRRVGPRAIALTDRLRPAGLLDSGPDSSASLARRAVLENGAAAAAAAAAVELPPVVLIEPDKEPTREVP